MDPFSLTTGVLGLMGICYQVGTVLKDYVAAVEIVDDKINALQATVQSFIQVLTLMENTLKQDEIKTSLHATGHISNHWHHLSASIRDGQEILFQLRDLLETVNRKASILSGPRKHQRLQEAAEEIAAYQQQIQGYIDTLQLSLQTVTLSKQVNLQESTDKILPKLEEVEQEVRRMAFTITRRMTELQSTIESRTGDSQPREGNQPEAPKKLRVLENLMNCVQSAATIVSDASTTLGIDQGRGGSDFGDCFPPLRNETMLRWIEDNTIREEHPDLEHSPHQRRESNGRGFGPVSRDIDESDSESETELEEEIIHSLIAKGKQALQTQNFSDAESHFFIGLNRTRGSRVPSSRISESKSELIQLLLETYRSQDKLVDAKSLLIDSIHMDPTNLGLLSDIRSVGEALFQKEDYPNALTCGMRALKAYRRLSSSVEKEKTLHMLIKICKAQGNHDDQLAFEAMLSHPQSHAGSRRNSLVSGPSSPRLDVQASKPNKRFFNGKALDLGRETRPIEAQSQKTDSPDLLGPIGEGEFLQWGEIPPRMASNKTTAASSLGLISNGQGSTWSPNLMATPEVIDTVLSINRRKVGMSLESNTPKAPSSGLISDSKGLLLPPSSSYFDSKPQPKNFPTGRRVQSLSSTNSVLGEPANIDRFEKELSSSFNGSGLLEQGYYAATPSRLPMRKGSETTSDSSWFDKESIKESLPHRTRQMTMPNLPSQSVPPKKLNNSTPKNAKIYKKVVVVGDSKCGKTPLLSLLAQKYCPEDPPPTQWDLYTFDVELDSKHIELAMWELGAYDKEGLSRLLSSPKPDAFLICFSIDCYDSLSQVKKKWVEDVKKFGKKAPYILVGLKSDLRSDSRTIEDLRTKGQRLTSADEGRDVAKLIEAEQYLECSAKTGEGVREILEAATHLTIQDRKKKKREDNKQKKDDGKRDKGSEDKKLSGILNRFKGKT